MTIHYDIETDGLYLEGLEKGIEKGIEKGRKEGLEKGISLKERDFTLKLWGLQEFSLEKITLLVGVTEEQITNTILAHLQEQGKTKGDAFAILETYRQKFPPPSPG